ncbi:hypothetical protein F3Y22_tig00110044pilonHSYRG00159 [Hibiscus syriacus]|uniref:Uncharacterized protein n=1 Tax=Hibiscus syriacus TaxID=106335 RepID=A0A6A3BLR5_HIBSY|nr:hypothetical protein F3Y22_tig00110044pilonHSYRG00159 [Hibiscus syriacus]
MVADSLAKLENNTTGQLNLFESPLVKLKSSLGPTLATLLMSGGDMPGSST